jgi:hypothetical protein
VPHSAVSWKSVRIALLLLILVGVLYHQASDRARFTSWETPIFVTIFPVNGDGSERARGYINALDADDFAPLNDFLRREAGRYGVKLHRPMHFEVGKTVSRLPPEPPVGAGFVTRAWWGIRLRWWRWRFDDQGTDADIIVLARYFDPQTRRTLADSTGIEGIRVAIANLFATDAMSGQNRVVLMHEILHTIGATDKYDLATLQPIHPAGYAEPARRPLHPQRFAEIMAGRVPVSANRARQVENLARVLVGPETASELGWDGR